MRLFYISTHQQHPSKLRINVIHSVFNKNTGFGAGFEFCHLLAM